MSRKVSLWVMISTLLFVETESDPIKDFTLATAGAKFPSDVVKQFQALALFPLLLALLKKLGPLGIRLISILNYFAPHLTPIANVLKDVLRRFVETIDPTVAQIINFLNLPLEAVPKLLKMLPLILPLFILSPVLGPFGFAIAVNALVKNGIVQQLLGNNLSLPTLATAFVILLLFKPFFPNAFSSIFEFFRAALSTYASLPDLTPLTPFTLKLILFFAIILTPVFTTIRKFVKPPGGLLDFLVFTAPFINLVFPKILPLLPKPLQLLLVPLVLLVQPAIAPFLLPIAPLLLKLTPILLKGPTWLLILFGLSLAPLLGLVDPFLVPLLPVFLLVKSLLGPLLPLVVPILLPFLGPLFGPVSLLLLPVLILGKILPLLLPFLGPLAPIFLLLLPLFLLPGGFKFLGIAILLLLLLIGPIALPLLGPILGLFLGPLLPLVLLAGPQLLSILGPLLGPLAPILLLLLPLFLLPGGFKFLGIAILLLLLLIGPIALPLLGPILGPFLGPLLPLVLLAGPKLLTILGPLLGPLAPILLPFLPIFLILIGFKLLGVIFLPLLLVVGPQLLPFLVTFLPFLGPIAKALLSPLSVLKSIFGPILPILSTTPIWPFIFPFLVTLLGPLAFPLFLIISTLISVFGPILGVFGPFLGFLGPIFLLLLFPIIFGFIGTFLGPLLAPLLSLSIIV